MALLFSICCLCPVSLPLSGVGNSPEIGNLLDPRRTIFCAFTGSIGGRLVMIVGLHHCLMVLMSCHAWCFCLTNLRLFCFKTII